MVVLQGTRRNQKRNYRDWSTASLMLWMRGAPGRSGDHVWPSLDLTTAFRMEAEA